MKIFVGGLMASRQRQIESWFPDVEFLFASDQDTDHRWVSRARRADVVIIDQGRTSHRIIDQLRADNIGYQFADGNAAIRKLIEERTNA